MCKWTILFTLLHVLFPKNWVTTSLSFFCNWKPFAQSGEIENMWANEKHSPSPVQASWREEKANFRERSWSRNLNKITEKLSFTQSQSDTLFWPFDDSAIDWNHISALKSSVLYVHSKYEKNLIVLHRQQFFSVKI